MTDDRELMDLFSQPRPSGSAAERAVLQAMLRWLDARGIAWHTHGFRLRPLFFECTGAWLIASRTLLAWAVARRWGWRALPLALVGQLGGTADILGLPLVTWPGTRRGQSLLIPFNPPGGEAVVERELLLCAHYDSKTELLDHRRRAMLLRGLRPGIVLTLAAALLAGAEARLRSRRPSVAAAAHALALVCALPVALLAWALGLHLLLGRLARPSSGAVDNGAACAVLLGLAERLATGRVLLRRTRVTIALFGGEEVNMQGSAAYVAEWLSREGVTRRTAAVNLELLGQRGPYVLWGRDGNALRTLPASREVVALLRDVIVARTGSEPILEPLINSDAYSFLRAQVPAATLGTADPRLGTTGLHRPSDSPGRVDLTRLPEHATLLEELIRRYDSD